MSDSPISNANKVTAKSGRLHYSEPIVISENTRTKIEAIPYFIDYSGEEKLTLKINFFTKTPTSRQWEHNKQKSFSLADSTVPKLKRAIDQFEALVGRPADAQYLLVPLGEESLQIGRTDKAKAVQALLNALSDPQILAHLDLGKLTDEVAQALKGKVRIAEMERATTQLELMLSSDENAEILYQKWFDEHYWVLGNAYVAKDDLRSISATDRVDLLMHHTASGMRDIIELKRPNMPVLHFDNAHRNFYFSADVSSAIGQCHRYLEVFSEEASLGLRDAPHIVAHYPEAVVVIGRSEGWPADKQKALRGLNSRLNGIKVMTFDHVLAQARALLDCVRPAEIEVDESAQTRSSWDDLNF